MNQVLLTRLFKSIEGDKDSSLMRVAYSIIEDEKKKGHDKLASKLTLILENSLEKYLNHDLKVIRQREFRIPADKRHKLPLATHVEQDELRHEMVLSKEVENKILRIENEYLARERLLHHGLQPRRKILLYGVSGCGKSMTAERIAFDLGLPFYKVRFDTIISSYLGESASNLQKLFESIESYPCVLLLDEFDIIGKQRDLKNNDVGEIHRIVNILLGLLEEYNGQGILIATTNIESSLDNALFRRFDDFIELPRPSENEIIRLLTNSFSALKLSDNVVLKEYSKKLEGMSSAIVVKIAQDAAKKSILNAKDKISNADLDESFTENKVLNR